MAEIVRMPKLSDTMTEGVVATWHKKVGDEVESGELLAEIETDKATMDFESFQDGVLLHIGVETGATAPVDSILCILGKKGEDIKRILADADKNVIIKDKESVPAPSSSPAPVEIVAPVALCSSCSSCTLTITGNTFSYKYSCDCITTCEKTR